jgi:hypothetical protein
LLTKSKGEATLSLAAAFVVRKGVVSDKRMNLQKGNPVDSARPTKKNTKTGGLAKAFVRFFLSFSSVPVAVASIVALYGAGGQSFRIKN